MFRVPAEFSMFQGSLGPKVRMYVPGIAWQKVLIQLGIQFL